MKHILLLHLIRILHSEHLEDFHTDLHHIYAKMWQMIEKYQQPLLQQHLFHQLLTTFVSLIWNANKYQEYTRSRHTRSTFANCLHEKCCRECIIFSKFWLKINWLPSCIPLILRKCLYNKYHQKKSHCSGMQLLQLTILNAAVFSCSPTLSTHYIQMEKETMSR